MFSLSFLILSHKIIIYVHLGLPADGTVQQIHPGFLDAFQGDRESASPPDEIRSGSVRLHELEESPHEHALCTFDEVRSQDCFEVLDAVGLSRFVTFE